MRYLRRVRPTRMDPDFPQEELIQFLRVLTLRTHIYGPEIPVIFFGIAPSFRVPAVVQCGGEVFCLL